MSFVIGSLFIKETKDRDIRHEYLAVRGAEAPRPSGATG